MNKQHKSQGVTKLATGILGFDALTGGGLPSGRLSLVLGGTGSGKTVFALQQLVHGAQRGEAGIFVSFNEAPQHLVENGAGFGWNLAQLEQDKLVFMDGRSRLGGANPFDLRGLLAGLHAVAAETGVRRIVLDSVELLLTLWNDPQTELQQLFQLRDWLLESGLTGLMTANLTGNEPRSLQRVAVLQSIADCSLGLSFHQTVGAAARHLRVVKYRGSNCLENEFPVRIGVAGLEVVLPVSAQAVGLEAVPASLHSEIAQARQHLSARVQAMGRFLEMKQAELDFLREKKSPRTGRSGVRRAEPLARRSLKAPAKSVS